MNPILKTKIIRTVMLIAVILLINRIPKQFLFVSIEIGIAALIAGSLLISWNKLMKRLRGSNKTAINENNRR